MRTALLVAALLFGAACKRDQPPGTPADLGAGGFQEPNRPMAPPKDPSDPANPSSANMGGNPHGGMGMGGGGGGDQLPEGHPPIGDDSPPPGTPPGHPPMQGGGGNSMAGAEDTAPRALDKAADGRHVLGPFTLAVPADWIVKPVTKGMRVAHFVLSAVAGEEADMIVFYQGEGGMGPVKDNLDRWAGQVQGKAVVEQVKFAGQDAHYMTISGDYKNETTGAAGKAQSVVGVIVQSPQGPYYFKLVGAKKTVDPQLAKVRAMFDGMKLK
ncbi:MAG: hypothetical protein KF773_26120 [Deltaproteobacteria bacterium]|nr:hypothetical protein [Deltaproteobacteria bacterium]MCW5802599.1 hypothetical protein [Deltaproteobacteria bacterium]